MKTKIVPVSELTPKNLTAHYYIPEATYYPDKRITFRVRATNNVLEEDDWSVVSITLHEERIVRLNIIRMGCSIPDFRLWNGIEHVLEWLSYDATGEHPEVYHEIWDPVEKNWLGITSMEEFVEVLSKCYRQGRGYAY